ncbi:MAG TPA: hypothetical protein VN641_06030 [Urbifossiella sp.]|nr:hypothetical protein [Urbifossiella sp.]
MTEEQLRLLTVAVDGALSPPEQWAVHALLVESVEARTALARLQSDSIRLRNVRKVQPPANLAPRIIARLPQVELAGQVARRDHRHRQLAALAASLFLAVATGAFFLTRPHGPQQNTGPETAHNNGQLDKVLPREAPSVVAVQPAVPSISAAPPPTAVVVVKPRPAPTLEPIPPPRLKGDRPADVLTAPPLVPIGPLARTAIRLPLLISVADLEQDDAKQRLVEELGREPAYRIDLFATDASRAAELFQAAAKKSGLTLHTDAGAANRIKRKQATAYLVYLECLTPAEVRDLLTAVSAADVKSHLFDALHAAPVVHADQVALKELLGVDPGLWKRPVKPTSGKPISAGTGDEIAKALTAPKPGDKHAVLLSFTPAAVRTHPTMSKELKEFLASRGERKASAVPVLIAIRHRPGA